MEAMLILGVIMAGMMVFIAIINSVGKRITAPQAIDKAKISYTHQGGGNAMRTFLRIGLGVCLWIVGFIGVVVTVGVSVQANGSGTEGLKVFAVFGGAWLVFYLLYRYIGSHWHAMRNTGRYLITLGCCAIFTGVGAFAWQTQALLYMFYVVVGIAFLVFFFAGGGGAYLPGGSAEREGMIKADLIGINNALNEIKKKL